MIPKRLPIYTVKKTKQFGLGDPPTTIKAMPKNEFFVGPIGYRPIWYFPSSSFSPPSVSNFLSQSPISHIQASGTLNPYIFLKLVTSPIQIRTEMEIQIQRQRQLQMP